MLVKDRITVKEIAQEFAALVQDAAIGDTVKWDALLSDCIKPITIAEHRR